MPEATSAWDGGGASAFSGTALSAAPHVPVRGGGYATTAKPSTKSYAPAVVTSVTITSSGRSSRSITSGLDGGGGDGGGDGGGELGWLDASDSDEYFDEIAQEIVRPRTVTTNASTELSLAGQLRTTHRRWIETQLAELKSAESMKGEASPQTKAETILHRACVSYCKAKCFKTAR